MQQRAGNQPQRGDDIDAPDAVALALDHQVKANRADAPQRPPEVDAAGQGELQIAAEHAFFHKSHQHKDRGPHGAKLEDVRTGERNRSEMKPAAPGQCCDERRECRESRSQATEEVKRTTWTAEIKVQDAATLDERDQGGRGKNDHECTELTEERRFGGKVVPLAEKVKMSDCE